MHNSHVIHANKLPINGLLQAFRYTPCYLFFFFVLTILCTVPTIGTPEQAQLRVNFVIVFICNCCNYLEKYINSSKRADSKLFVEGNYNIFFSNLNISFCY